MIDSHCIGGCWQGRSGLDVNAIDPEHWQSIPWLAAQLLLGAACMAVTIVHFVMEPLRWNSCYLPASADLRTRTNMRDALYCTALATYVLPFKLGIPLRIFLLRRNGQLTLHFLGAAIGLDGIVSLCIWSLLAVVCAWATALRWHPPWYLWAAAAAIAAICIAIVVVQRTLGLRWLRRLQDALKTFDRPWRRIGRSATILTLDVLSYGLRHALIVLLVTGDFAAMAAGAAIGIVATFTGIISGLPMGLVGYDATLIALLALAGVHADQALAIALINRLMNLSSAALLGIPAAMRLGLGSTLGSIIRRLREIANGKT
jgi:uncharacterized membrane protein YbhN (UPF0104 family)